MAKALSSPALAGKVASFPQAQYPGDTNGCQPFTITTLPSLMLQAPVTLFLGPLLLLCQLVVKTSSRPQLWLPWRLAFRSNKSGCPVSARKSEVGIVGMKTCSLEDASYTKIDFHVDVVRIVVWPQGQSPSDQLEGGTPLETPYESPAT